MQITRITSDKGAPEGRFYYTDGSGKECFEEGELFLAVHDGVNSQKIYRFIMDDGRHIYRLTSCHGIPVSCPECNIETSSYPWTAHSEGFDQEHEPSCKFSRPAINQMYRDKNSNLAEAAWLWGDPWFTLETAIFHLLESSSFRMTKEYDALKRLIDKNEEALYAKYNPESYARQYEIEKMHKKLDNRKKPKKLKGCR